jgi:hypothetical protein
MATRRAGAYRPAWGASSKMERASGDVRVDSRNTASNVGALLSRPTALITDYRLSTIPPTTTSLAYSKEDHRAFSPSRGSMKGNILSSVP